MKAPSKSCLRVMRRLAYPISPHLECLVQRRCYAAVIEKPSSPRTFKTPSSPANPEYLRPPATLPPSSKRALKPPPAAKPAAAAPRAVFRPTPTGPDLRKKHDDDEDFTPYPLTRPIGMPDPPEPTDNIGLDRRTLRQRRDDFHNYDKHIQRRANMTKQIAKPYFRDWSNMRFFKGKVFIAPERLFRGDVALWFPNFFGKTAAKDVVRRGIADGYGGLGRGTTEVMRNKVSVVSIVSNMWAQGQVDTFCGKEQNPDLHRVLAENQDLAQRVEINYENNFLKWWLLQIFASGLRKTRTPAEQERYFMVRRGVTDIMKEAIGLLNDKGGYVYLVDQECKIRWAGSAEASSAEKQSLVEGLRRLIKEAKTPKEERIDPVLRKEQLEAAVTDLTDEAALPEKAAAAA
ncbi:hypothetical protein BAUCODRAFT_29205 [Baudoinia panamericana UAMH 10762]|uniref:Mitochondrial ATPase complex subunit ATP10 n=1 Tax=Baudoinia panamericana (strain UAMH 10762) TaxID=717646 RepID=M2MV48_BAUPA|nr:uncharacterized protein BAUCODRAFT_29205 [Baudoinia panamericana UAMH 10762]EMD00827.1 hypothetical protein BAUCODRAFT_29205 [Baudoinia panamericana UAMH 10762]